MAEVVRPRRAAADLKAIRTTLIVALLAPAGALASCKGGAAQKGQASSSVEQAISKALAARERAPVVLIETTEEQRDGHRVACGLYQRADDAKKGLVRQFGWIDGQLVMQWGPVWNAATRCLIDHYNAPLP